MSRLRWQRRRGLGQQTRRHHGASHFLGLEHAALEHAALYEGRDLPVTTDFRAVFSEVAGQHLGQAPTAGLFSGWNGARIPLIRGDQQ